MRVLTVKQPWATLIARGVKAFENRSYPPPRAIADGTRFAIHAGQGWDAEGAARVEKLTGQKFDRKDFPRGVIVCTVRVVGVVTDANNIHFVGPFGWQLADVRPASSKPVRGKLSLWTLPDDEIDTGDNLHWHAGQACHDERCPPGDGVHCSCRECLGGCRPGHCPASQVCQQPT